MNSHVQTRTLSDALDSAEAVLVARNTTFRADRHRTSLADCFAKSRYPKFFGSWAFVAADFDAARRQVEACAPGLAASLVRPTHPNDFTIVGNCSLDLRFDPDANGADPVRLRLQNGRYAAGAKVTASTARLYSNGLAELPTTSGEKVYFYCPSHDAHSQTVAAELARAVFSARSTVRTMGITLKFPRARTFRLPEYPWVTSLQSACNLYRVVNFVSAGHSLVDHNGFFAQETQVVQVKYRCLPKRLPDVVIDRPFLVLFADGQGVHAAAWFDWDSFELQPTTVDAQDRRQES